jgi:hypothetical protein
MRCRPYATNSFTNASRVFAAQKGRACRGSIRTSVDAIVGYWALTATIVPLNSGCVNPSISLSIRDIFCTRWVIDGVAFRRPHWPFLVGTAEQPGACRSLLSGTGTAQPKRPSAANGPEQRSLEQLRAHGRGGRLGTGVDRVFSGCSGVPYRRLRPFSLRLHAVTRRIRLGVVTTADAAPCFPFTAFMLHPPWTQTLQRRQLPLHMMLLLY